MAAEAVGLLVVGGLEGGAAGYTVLEDQLPAAGAVGVTDLGRSTADDAGFWRGFFMSGRGGFGGHGEVFGAPDI
jgi:hypothetical protein